MQDCSAVDVDDDELPVSPDSDDGDLPVELDGPRRDRAKVVLVQLTGWGTEAAS